MRRKKYFFFVFRKFSHAPPTNICLFLSLEASAAGHVMFPNSCGAVRFVYASAVTKREWWQQESLSAQGTVREEQTLMLFHCKHMVKLKCVIYLGLRVAWGSARTHTHTLLQWQGVIYLGPMGGPVSRCTCHTHTDSSTQFKVFARDEKRVKPNFPRPESRRVRNHTLTEMLETTALNAAFSVLSFFLCPPPLPPKKNQIQPVGVAAHPVSHPLQFINLALFQSCCFPPVKARRSWRSWEQQWWRKRRQMRGVRPLPAFLCRPS